MTSCEASDPEIEHKVEGVTFSPFSVISCIAKNTPTRLQLAY